MVSTGLVLKAPVYLDYDIGALSNFDLGRWA